MHKCEVCGTEFDSKFCPNCGAPAPLEAAPAAAENPAVTEAAPPQNAEIAQDIHAGERDLALAKKTKSFLSRKMALVGCTMGFIPAYGALTVVLGFILSFFPKFSEWNPGKLGKDRRNILALTVASCILAVGMLVGGILIHLLALPAMENNPGIDIWLIVLPVVVWFGFVSEVAAIILGVLTVPLGNELVVDFYGRSDPIYEVDTPRISVQELTRCLAIAAHNHSTPKSRDEVHLGALALVLLYLIAVAIAVPVTLFTDPYRNSPVTLENAKKIRLGADKAAVQLVLGEPHVSPMEKEPDKYVWVYAGGEYLKLEDRAAEIMEKQEQALLDGDLEKVLELEEDANKIAEQARELEYKQIVINFDEEEKVSSVFFDTCYCDKTGLAAAKYFEESSVVYSATSCSSMEQFEKLSASVTYEDGSYYNGYIPVGTYTLEGNSCYITWQPPRQTDTIGVLIAIVGDWLPAPEE